mmetsp:Transcript_41322/g.96884  ORF Transcript_41322/g.96884 Transcript_41322/m.96884 type:complete len:179 (-) Transcript_41322:401-937(-)
MSNDLTTQNSDDAGASNPLAILNAATKIADAAKEKWNSSGAAQYVKAATDNLPEGTRDVIGNVQRSIFRRENLRSFSVYTGFGEERPFYFERSPDLLIDRIRHNLTYFFLNYGVLTVFLFILSVITNPATLIKLAIIALMWVYVVKMTESGSIVIAGESCVLSTLILIQFHFMLTVSV